MILLPFLFFITLVSANSSSSQSPPIPTSTSLSSSSSSNAIGNLLDKVFKNHTDEAPKDCTPIPGESVVNVCNNNTDPLLKIYQLTIDPYPLVPGHIKFNMIYELIKEIPQGTTLKLTSFSEHGPIYDGYLEFCDYSTFARIFCPVKPSEETLQMNQVLEVPDDVPSGNYSFFISARNPDDEVITNIAASIEIKNDNVLHEHGDDL